MDIFTTMITPYKKDGNICSVPVKRDFLPDLGRKGGT